MEDRKATGLKNRDADAAPFLESIAGPLTFGRLLRAIRLGDGMSQSAFASKLGVAPQNISDIENGRRAVSVERAAEWAEILAYGKAQFVRLVLQAQVDAAGVELDVDVKPRANR